MNDVELQEKVKKMYVDSGAWMTGHFRLTSGKHSGNYMQSARLLCHPEYAAFCGAELAKKIAHLRPDFISSPAIGGLIIGHEVARALNVPFFFCEREGAEMKLRRFEMPVGKSFVVVEDVVTTGGSVRETGEHLVAGGCTWLGSACITDRSGGKNVLGGNLYSLIRVLFPVWEADDCPLCRELGTPPVKPGSRPDKK